MHMRSLLVLREASVYSTWRCLVGGLVLTIIVLTSGCINKQVANNEGKAKEHKEVTYNEESKADIRKAALANVELGHGYLEQGQVVRAKKKLVHALKLIPNLPEGLTAMGYFWERVGDSKEAEKYYKKAIAVGKGGKGAVYGSYGNFLCRESRYQEADKAFDSALQDRDYLNTAEIYESAGLCAISANTLDKAEDYFMRAIRYDNKRARSWVELTTLVFNRGDTSKASEYLATFRKQVELNPRLLWLSIQIARQQQDEDAVASEGLLLKNMFPDSPEYKLYNKSTRLN